MAVELYEKELVRPGWYAADGGPTYVTPQRIERWEKEFQELRKEGFAFPTPWGHKLQALPTDGSDPYALDEKYARWNAGDMEWVHRKNGRLYLIGTVPPGYKIDDQHGRLVNEHDGTIVRHVSPGFGDWQDGQGRYHEDVLFHTALCTHPVQHDQEGFRRITELPSGLRELARTGGRRFLSSASKVRRVTMMALPKGKFMAADSDDKPKEKPDMPSPDEDVLPPIGEDGIGPIDAAPAPDVLPPEPAVPDPVPDLGSAGSVITPEQAAQFVQIMQQLGAPMLPGTNNTNIIERLLVLLHAAVNQGATLSPQGAGQQQTPLDMSMDGASPDSNGMGAGMGMSGGPTFMSTRTKRPVQLDPAGRSLALAAAEKEKKAIDAAWDRIASAPGVPATLRAIALREKVAANSYFMSLNPDSGKVTNERARQKLWFAQELLTASGTYKVLGLLSKGVAQSTPAAKAPRPKPSTEQASNNDLKAEIARLTNRDPKEIPLGEE